MKSFIKKRKNLIANKGLRKKIAICSVVVIAVGGLIAANSNNTNNVEITNLPSSSGETRSMPPEAPLGEQVSDTPKVSVYSVSRVVDGDTIDVLIDGVVKRIRLIGVNTPETVDPNSPQECFGKEASDYMKNLLSGKSVSLEEDQSQGDKDKYDRLLRFVFLEGENINLKLINDGYAYEYTYNVPYKYQTEFKAAQKDAEANGRGLWSPTTCDGKKTAVDDSSGSQAQESPSVPVPAVQPRTESAQPQAEVSCTIKGNINNKGERIYHVPGQRYYNSTKIDESKGERWFCTEQEAIAAGWRKSKV